MQSLENVIAETESNFPSSGFLPAMCFQLAQHYWPDNVPMAKKWLDKTLSVTKPGDYYYELVKLRYKNWNNRGSALVD